MHSLSPRVFTRLVRWDPTGNNRTLHTMLSITRGFLATDLRDKVYALLGLTSEYKPLDANGITPDYGKPVGDVYLETTRALFLKRKYAMFLTLAGERHGGTRPCPHLPDSFLSWVPDLACPMYPGVDFCHGCAYFPQLMNCGNSEKRTNFIFDTDSERHLGVKVAWLDTIIECSEGNLMAEPGLSINYSIMQDWVKLTNNLPSTYPTGEHRLDVLHDTISRKTLHVRPHIHRDFEKSYHDLLLLGILQQAIAILHEKAPNNDPDRSSQLSEAADLTGLAALEETSNVPRSKSLTERWNEFVAWHVQHCNGNYADTSSTRQRIEPSLTCLSDRWGFRLCQTEADYLCRGPNTMQCGDSIWIVDGSTCLLCSVNAGLGNTSLLDRFTCMES